MATKKITKKVVKKELVVKAPKTTKKTVCTDRHCPVHGNIKTRGRVFEGVITKAKMAKTVVVQWPRRLYLSKYERFEKRKSHVMAHNPACINAKEGMRVKIAECRPISKAKNFVIVEVVSK
jgi:small subunit ribosomal protein S17